MSTVTFDTLKFSDTLKAAGIPATQAEAEARALAEAFAANSSDIATTTDVREVRNEIDLLRKDIQAMEPRLTVKLGVFISLAVGVDPRGAALAALKSRCGGASHNLPSLSVARSPISSRLSTCAGVSRSQRAIRALIDSRKPERALAPCQTGSGDPRHRFLTPECLIARPEPAGLNFVREKNRTDYQRRGLAPFTRFTGPSLPTRERIT